jgi:REP element-mobilizing transposase RayT
MARPLRIQYEGALYHVTCRGIERRDIFLGDEDRKTFLKFLKESVEAYQVIIYCYVLMSNHFHIIIETPHGNLSEYMRCFNITYTYYFNRKYKRVGNLYQGRYKSILVEKESYLNILSRYIHVNPVQVKKLRNKLFREKLRYLRNYPWSSLIGYLNSKKRESFLTCDIIFEQYGGDNAKGRESYWRQIQNDLSSEMDINKQIVGGCLLGSDGFIEKIKKRYLKREKREVPSIRRIHKYKSVDLIFEVVCKELGIEFDELKNNRGEKRQILMEVLYRYSGLNGREIGEVLGLDYSTVSVGRKRLVDEMKKDKELEALFRRIENNLSIIKI